MCKSLRKIKGVESVELYALNYKPKKKIDVMIYLNGTKPHAKWADKHVLYMQNFYPKSSDKMLRFFQKIDYDGYVFISKKILDIHEKKGYKGIFLPFGIDTDFFCPRKKDTRFEFEVAHVGNDTKGKYRTNKYLLPAKDFKFGLFGCWKISKKQWLKRILGLWRLPYYKKVFINICKRRISQAKVPVLYSSSKIILNCSNQGYADWDAITLRTFEVLACRGFLISDKVPSAEKILRDCVVFSEGGEDLKSKIRYYLENEKERVKIAEKGYNYVIKHASIKSRMEKLYKYLRTLK
ncbi:hypothetical protein ES703_125013 [subsurface metagenome]